MGHPVNLLSLLALGLTAGLLLVAPTPLHAQDSSTMQHDSAMMHEDSGMMDKSEMGHAMETPNLMFMGAGKRKASGDYEIVDAKGKQTIKFTQDFAVEPAPDTYLVLAASDQPDAQSLYLAKLKKPIGSQSYDVPKGTDFSKYSKLLIWSKKSHALLASADLAASGHMMMDK